jgi:Na+-transporting methylmalonyl-CoA/oxaloacetate decarboxylase gamma subunit
VALDHVAGNVAGRLAPPEAGEVVMSVLSPEALVRERQQVEDVVRHAADTDEPLVIIVEAAEELREDELAAVLAAAAHTHRRVILRVMADA